MNKQKQNVTLKITEQKPLLGEISLSGDSYASIILLLNRLFLSDDVKINNVPRSNLVIDTLQLFKKIGIDNSWADLYFVTCHTKQIDSDLTKIDGTTFCSGDTFIKVIKLLIPLILFRESNCIVGVNMIEEAKFYKANGFMVSHLDKKIVISVPNFLPAITSIHTDFDDVVDQSARIFLNYLYQDTIKVEYDNSNLVIKKLLDKSSTGIVNINTNLHEFAFYVTLAAITRGECVFSNINMPDVLEYLIILEKLGVKYEAYNKNLKVWASDFIIDSYYDLSKYDYLLLSLLLTILFRHNHTKDIKVLVNRSQKVKSILRDLNMLGLKVSSRNINTDTDYELISLKIVKTISPIRVPYVTENSGGFIICLAASFAGNHSIQNLSDFQNLYPFLLDNLNNLNLN